MHIVTQIYTHIAMFENWERKSEKTNNIAYHTNTLSACTGVSNCINAVVEVTRAEHLEVFLFHIYTHT